MIAYLSGTIQARTENFFIINSNGVGYLVFPPRDLLIKFHEGNTAELYISTQVREQEISLYGFETLSDRQFFELLISVSGIGPKSALEFLSLPTEAVKDAISAGDINFLSKVKGVGKKTAERVIVELKNKVGSIITPTIIQRPNEQESKNASEDIILALEGLGYERMDIIKRMKNAPVFQSSEEAVLWFLQNQ